MATDNKNEYAGLEVAYGSERPEVAYGKERPEVAYGRERPEVYHPPDGPEVVAFLSPHSNEKSQSDLPEPLNARPHPSNENGLGPGHQDANQAKRRYCGMRGWILALLVVGVIAIIAVVLGAALGTTLGDQKPSHASAASGTSSHTSSTSQSTPNPEATSGSREAIAQSGLAVIFPGDNAHTLLTYYQDRKNRIIENIYEDGAWQSQSSTKDSVVLASGAQPRSPLAAISYAWNGVTYRQVFFVANDQTLGTVTVSANGSWSSAEAINPDPDISTTPFTVRVAPGPGLAACWGRGNLQGLRLYFGSSENYIQEFGRALNDTRWASYYHFPQSDASTGVGCDYIKSADQRMNVYFRNTASDLLQQSYWSFVEDGSWTAGPTASRNAAIDSGSAIAVTSDQQVTEYVLFQNSNGTITRGLVNLTKGGFETFDHIASAIGGTKLAAAYYAGGSLYMFQNSTSNPTIWLDDIASDGSRLSSQKLPGSGGD